MSTKLKTGKVRFGYVNVFEARVNGDEKDPKYSVMVIVDKTDKETLSAFKAAFDAAKEVGKEKCKDWKGKIPPNVRQPLRDGDTEKPDSPELAGKYFFNAKANLKNKPQVVKKGQGGLVAVTDPAEFQSGDYGKASISLFAYNKNGNSGIGVGLNSIFFMEEGERLTGASSAQADFADEVEGETDDWLAS